MTGGRLPTLSLWTEILGISRATVNDSPQMNPSIKVMEEALADVPMLDIHTHLVGGQLGARGLHDVLLYHMVITDLYAAGCPNGARLTQYPGEPSPEEARQRIEEALPFLPAIQNTSGFWGVRL